jgi:hypothetical protein
MFTKREDAPAYVVIEDVWSEPLEELTEEDAAKEGNYTREEFIEEWKRIHGEWNPEQTVYVIEFTGFEEDPRTP